MTIKRRYMYLLIVIFIFVVAGPVALKVYYPKSDVPPTILEALGIFAALAAAVIALAIADQPEKKAILEVKLLRPGHKVRYDKKDIKTHGPAYSGYPDPFFSYRVYFELTNRSRFPLKDCMITVDVPRTCMQPTKPEKGNWTPHINNNLQIIGQPIGKFKTEERWQLTSRLISEWHPGDTRRFYLRMALSHGQKPSHVKISVSCRNADGWEDSVPIDIDTLLAGAEFGGHNTQSGERP